VERLQVMVFNLIPFLSNIALQDPNASLHKAALEGLRNRIRSSTTSMTSVPKPLKFLNPHYSKLIEIHSKMSVGPISKALADILSVLSMTYASESEFNVLKYRIMGSQEPIDSWGHEYVRHLAMEVGKDYAKRLEEEKPTDDLKKISLEMIPFFLSHNAEPDACDLLLELECLGELPKFLDVNTWSRVCLYLVSCVSYVPFPEDVEILKTVRQIYLKFQKIPEALSISMRLNNPEMIKSDFNSCKDP
jgi:26S proteasome regulatory subunit N1